MKAWEPGLLRRLYIGYASMALGIDLTDDDIEFDEDGQAIIDGIDAKLWIDTMGMKSG